VLPYIQEGKERERERKKKKRYHLTDVSNTMVTSYINFYIKLPMNVVIRTWKY